MALARTGIFVAVYSIILGLPFLAGFQLLDKGLWLVPVSLMAVFASMGPFLYFYIDRRTENALLKEQRQYQYALRQASMGMGRIKDLRRLLDIIVRFVTRTVRLEHATIYVMDPQNGDFSWGVARSWRLRAKPQGILNKTGALVEAIRKNPTPLLYEEIEQQAREAGNLSLVHLEEEMRALDAALAVPCMVNDRVLAVIILGKKISQKIYSDDDLSVFAILANQAALVMENMKSVEEMKRTQERLFHAEKLAYVGQLASSVVHEVRNPLTAIKTFVEFLPEKFRARDLNFLERFERVIPREIHRMDRMVKELLDLARPRKIRKKETGLCAIISGTLGLLKDNFDLKRIRVRKQFAEDDRIWCDEEQIQQVMLNLILNAMDAMKDGGELSVRVWREDVAAGQERMKVSVKDTGCGISAEGLKILFTPFHTTKKEGVGLGLIITEEIVKLHGGEMQVASEVGRGTEFTIGLPVR
jgi:signal transduction histidine kinase